VGIIGLFDKYAPGPLEVSIFLLGFSLLLAALGVVKTLPLGKSTIPIPTERKWKIGFGLSGFVLVLTSIAISLQKPVWKPGVSEELVYKGGGKAKAQQIVADGERLYVLTSIGNIMRADKNDKEGETVDPGTNTKQIAAAGGLLYVLKDTGEIWAVMLAEKRRDYNYNYNYKKIDPGINTRQILAIGEALYVLKKSGEVWRVWTPFSEGNDKAGEVGLKREFIRLRGLEDVEQIASSGTMLFILKRDGAIQRYFPMPESKSALMDMKECGQAKYIAVDGGTLYLIDAQNDEAFICRPRSRTPLFGGLKRLFKGQIVKKIDASGGMAYILTNEGNIWGYGAVNDRLRPTALFKSAAEDPAIISIAAHHQGCFAVKNDGSVWRYSEFIRKQ